MEVARCNDSLAENRFCRRDRLGEVEGRRTGYSKPHLCGDHISDETSTVHPNYVGEAVH